MRRRSRWGRVGKKKWDNSILGLSFLVSYCSSVSISNFRSNLNIIMKRFKPFTLGYEKKTKWADYRDYKMKELAEINWENVSLKEKYWRMDFHFYEVVSDILYETMEDYEAMSEESCMYCNKYTWEKGQYWTHEDSRLIHLCLPCLIGDKITILLEKIITRWRKLTKSWTGWLSYSS